MKHIISAVVENQPGVLARIVGLISGRGYNIHSLNVAPTQDPTTSRITMVVPGDDRILEQVTKQLNKLVDVIKVYDLTKEKFVGRELVLVKVKTTAKSRSAVVELAALFQARVVFMNNKSLTIQMVGSEDEVNSFLELVKPNGILDISRTGVIAVGKQEDEKPAG
ncbi:acetolactate synthase small subunit [Verrucomicrobiota bacterium]